MMSTNAPERRPIADADLATVRSRYQTRIAQQGVTLASMNTGGEVKQRIRHAVHAELVCPDDAVLDVGCGIGQFCTFLRDHGYRGNYHGIDIVPEYVAHCAAQFPAARFELGDVFQIGIRGQPDVIVASQVFNDHYRDSDNADVLKRFLSVAFEASRRAVTVDMLTSYVDFTVPELYYFAPDAMFAFAKSLTRFVRLRHDYLPFEFSIQLFKTGVEPA